MEKGAKSQGGDAVAVVAEEPGNGGGKKRVVKGDGYDRGRTANERKKRRKRKEKKEGKMEGGRTRRGGAPPPARTTYCVSKEGDGRTFVFVVAALGLTFRFSERCFWSSLMSTILNRFSFLHRKMLSSNIKNK